MLFQRRATVLCLLSCLGLVGCEISDPQPVSRVVGRAVLVSAAPEMPNASQYAAKPEPAKTVAKGEAITATSSDSGQNVAKSDVKVSGAVETAQPIDKAEITPIRTVSHTVESANSVVQAAQRSSRPPAVPPMVWPAVPPPLVLPAMPPPLVLPEVPPPLPVVAEAESPVAECPVPAAPSAPLPVVAEVEEPTAERPAPAMPKKLLSNTADISAFGHAADYCWISGKAQKWRQDWRLRYAPVDQEDRYGGCVTLIGEEHFDKLTDGGHVKIRGRLEVNDGKTGAVFYIDAVEPMP
jgi:hypothetical protein